MIHNNFLKRFYWTFAQNRFENESKLYDNMPTKAFDYMMLMVTLEAVFENTQVRTQMIRIRWSKQSGLRIASTKSESILQNPILELTPEFEGTLKDEIRKHESHDNLSHDYNYFATTNENSILAKWFLKTKLFQKRLNVNKVTYKSLSINLFYEAIFFFNVPLANNLTV